MEFGTEFGNGIEYARKIAREEVMPIAVYFENIIRYSLDELEADGPILRYKGSPLGNDLTLTLHARDTKIGNYECGDIALVLDIFKKELIPIQVKGLSRVKAALAKIDGMKELQSVNDKGCDTVGIFDTGSEYYKDLYVEIMKLANRLFIGEVKRIKQAYTFSIPARL